MPALTTNLIDFTVKSYPFHVNQYDEAFVVLKGSIILYQRDGAVVKEQQLHQGDHGVIKSGIEHRFDAQDFAISQVIIVEDELDND